MILAHSNGTSKRSPNLDGKASAKMRAGLDACLYLKSKGCNMATTTERLKRLEQLIGDDGTDIIIKPCIGGAQFYKVVNGQEVELTESEVEKIKIKPGEDIEVILPPGFDM